MQESVNNLASVGKPGITWVNLASMEKTIPFMDTINLWFVCNMGMLSAILISFEARFDARKVVLYNLHLMHWPGRFASRFISLASIPAG